MSEPFETSPGKTFSKLIGELVIRDEAWRDFLVDPGKVFTEYGVGTSEAEKTALRKGIADVISAGHHKRPKLEVLQLILEHASDTLAHAAGKEPSDSAIMTVAEELRRWPQNQE